MAQPLSADPLPSPFEKELKDKGDLSGGPGAGLGDWIFRNLTLVFALTTVVFIFGIAITLFLASRANISHTGFAFLHTTTWDPVAADTDKLLGDIYGVLPFVYGTLVTSAIALFWRCRSVSARRSF